MNTKTFEGMVAEEMDKVNAHVTTARCMVEELRDRADFKSAGDMYERLDEALSMLEQVEGDLENHFVAQYRD